MSHTWVPTIMREASLRHPVRPEVRFFPHCFDCGAQAAPHGKGVIYRATSRDEWSTTEPPCAADTKGKDEP